MTTSEVAARPVYEKCAGEADLRKKIVDLSSLYNTTNVHRVKVGCGKVVS